MYEMCIFIWWIEWCTTDFVKFIFFPIYSFPPSSAAPASSGSVPIHSRSQPNRFSPSLEVLFRIPIRDPVVIKIKKTF